VIDAVSEERDCYGVLCTECSEPGGLEESQQEAVD